MTFGAQNILKMCDDKIAERRSIDINDELIERRYRYYSGIYLTLLYRCSFIFHLNSEFHRAMITRISLEMIHIMYGYMDDAFLNLQSESCVTQFKVQSEI